MRLSTLLSILALGVLAGCPVAKDDTADTDADTDTDTDADTDADTDTDVTEFNANATAAVDGGVVGNAYTYEVNLTATMDAESLDGSLTYVYTEDGSAVCDFTDHVVGTAYTGDCADCTFAYDIASTNVEDNSTADCDPSPTYSLRGGGVYTDLFISGIDVFEGYYGNYYNVFRVGFGVDYTDYGYGVYPGPYYSYLAYDGGYGEASWDSSSLEWNFASDGVSTDFSSYYYYCDYNYTYYAYDVYPGSGGTGTVNCDASDVDTWTFEVAEGATTYVTVDTVADATAFDPRAWVNDPDGCTVAYADDSFDCTFPPPNYMCPGMVLEDLDPGTYTLVVSSYGDCSSDTVDYSVNVYSEVPM